ALRIIGCHQVRTQIRGTNRIGLGFFQILSLIVSVHRHREGKADNKTQKRQRGGSNNIEILSLTLLAKSSHLPAKNIADICGSPLQHEDSREYDKRAIDCTHDTRPSSLSRPVALGSYLGSYLASPMFWKCFPRRLMGIGTYTIVGAAT